MGCVAGWTFASVRSRPWGDTRWTVAGGMRALVVSGSSFLVIVAVVAVTRSEGASGRCVLEHATMGRKFRSRHPYPSTSLWPRRRRVFCADLPSRDPSPSSRLPAMILCHLCNDSACTRYIHSPKHRTHAPTSHAQPRQRLCCNRRSGTSTAVALFGPAHLVLSLIPSVRPSRLNVKRGLRTVPRLFMGSRCLVRLSVPRGGLG